MHHICENFYQLKIEWKYKIISQNILILRILGIVEKIRIIKKSKYRFIKCSWIIRVSTISITYIDKIVIIVNKAF